jgi:hypothetical protein
MDFSGFFRGSLVIGLLKSSQQAGKIKFLILFGHSIGIGFAKKEYASLSIVTWITI